MKKANKFYFMYSSTAISNPPIIKVDAAMQPRLFHEYDYQLKVRSSRLTSIFQLGATNSIFSTKSWNRNMVEIQKILQSQRILCLSFTRLACRVFTSIAISHAYSNKIHSDEGTFMMFLLFLVCKRTERNNGNQKKKGICRSPPTAYCIFCITVRL